MSESYQIWCDTCEGSGEIDETLGGEYFNNPHAKCPDCEGKGYWLKEFGKEEQGERNMEHVWKVGDKFEVVGDKYEIPHRFSIGDIVTLFELDEEDEMHAYEKDGTVQWLQKNQVRSIVCQQEVFDCGAKKHSHYFKECPYDYIDVYRILEMFDVTDPCIAHATKKLLCAGARGVKDTAKDIQEAIDTLVRYQEMREEEKDNV